MFTVTGTERIKMGMGTKRKKEKRNCAYLIQEI